MTIIPLILRADPVGRIPRGDQRRRSPNVAVVYATADGTVDVVDGFKPIGFSDHLSGRYSMRYEVDLSDHHRTIELRTAPPPAMGGIYHFQTQVNIGFRVSDPAEVVRRNVHDGLQVVCDHLMYTFRDITSTFRIEDALGAENAINNRFRRGELIEGYIELYMCRARLRPDAEATAYLQAAGRAQRKNVVNAAEHETNVDDAFRANELGGIEQTGSLQRRERERLALAGRSLDARDLLRVHLENNPGDTENAVQIAAQLEAQEHTARVEAEERDWGRFQFMARERLLQAGDVAPLRASVVRSASTPATSLPAGSGGSGWDEPLPGLGSGARTGYSAAAATGPGLIPIYVVVDGSMAVGRAGLRALNEGLAALYDAVAGNPEVAGVVRLGVMSYADVASVRLALQPVRPGQRPPELPAGIGPARLSPAFERLVDCIPRDAAVLRSETTSLRRPQVIMLSAGDPADEPAWQQPHRILTDRTAQRYAPDVIACGVAEAAPATVLRIATRPEQAFVSPGGDVADAINRFYAFAQRRVVEYGEAVLQGDQNAVLIGPDGFRPARELTAGG